MNNNDEQYGHGLALINGDLIFDNDPIDGLLKLRTIHGKPNLLQALQLRILTPFGSDCFNITYGLDVTEAFTQPIGTHMVKELIKLNLVRTLGTDPRVRDIREVLFEDEPLFLARHPEISPQTVINDRHRRFWQVETVIDTVAEQTETISTTIGV